MNLLDSNLSALRKRYPALAKRVDAFPDKANVIIFRARDGGLAYGLKGEKQITPITDPVNPEQRIQVQLETQSTQLQDLSRPVMIIGLYPGTELKYIYDLGERTPPPHAQQKLFVCIDSIPCLLGYMQVDDLSAIIRSERVRLFWHEDAETLAAEFGTKPEWSPLFSLVTGSLNGVANRVMGHFVNLLKTRSTETRRLIAENEAYYDGISDDALAVRIAHGAERIARKAHDTDNQKPTERNKETPSRFHTPSHADPHAPVAMRHAPCPMPSARRPKLMTLTCNWSTVTQHSARDLCEALENEGWQTQRLNMDQTPTPHYVVQQINSFKPDVFLFINHLRTDSPEIYPRNMMFITWIQDTMPAINNREAAAAWNKMALSTVARDEDPSPRITRMNTDKASSSSVISVPSVASTSSLFSSPRRRDLIIGYVGDLLKCGYSRNRLVEMPMIVSRNIFKPRVLTEEQKAKYGCDVMFASNGSRPTHQIVRDVLVPAFANLKPEPIRTEDRTGRKELTTDGTEDTDTDQDAVGVLQTQNSNSNSSFPSRPLRSSVHNPPSVPSLNSVVDSAFFGESLLMRIHDHLWTEYRAGRTFTSCQTLEQELRKVEGFSSIYDSLSEDNRDQVMQTLFWRLNDIIYRHVVLEWADEIAQSAERRAHSVGTLEKAEVPCSPELHAPCAMPSAPSSHAPCPMPSAPVAMPSAPVAMPSAPCPMPSAPCPMPSAPRAMPSAPRAMPLRIHLYGNGWEQHPRFAKYARGPIEHGEELSIAYQAARYCLHLNSAEGQHQRMHEIMACGASLLTRTSKSVEPAAGEPPRNLMWRLASASGMHGGATASFDPFSDAICKTPEEKEALTDWVFNMAFSMAQEDAAKKVEAPVESLEHRVMETIQRALDSRLDWNVKNWEEHCFTDRKGLERITTAPVPEHITVP